MNFIFLNNLLFRCWCLFEAAAAQIGIVNDFNQIIWEANIFLVFSSCQILHRLINGRWFWIFCIVCTCVWHAPLYNAWQMYWVYGHRHCIFLKQVYNVQIYAHENTLHLILLLRVLIIIFIYVLLPFTEAYFSECWVKSYKLQKLRILYNWSATRAFNLF